MGQNWHMDRPEVSSPSHHLMTIRYSLDSRCKSKLVEGTTDSQEGLPLTGYELCWHVKKNPSSWQKLVLDHS